MESIRKPFQGVGNIIRFNWHFYLLSVTLAFFLLFLKNYFNEPFHIYFSILLSLILLTTVITLLVSFYVYDLSGLYKLNWLSELLNENNNKIVNINSGFDETSILLKEKFPDSELIVFDFYNPLKHTEVSISRARKAYPPFPNTIQVSTSAIPLDDNYADKIFVILSAHEIRNESERIIFFKELERMLNQKGQIIVTEHLRNLPNFFAYNIGAFHFFSESSWKKIFETAHFKIVKTISVTSFIKTFILEKYGTTS